MFAQKPRFWGEVPKNWYFSRFSTHNSKTSSSFNSISENIAYIETQNSLDYVEAIQIHFSLCFCGSKPLRIPKRTCFWKKELEMAIGRTFRPDSDWISKNRWHFGPLSTKTRSKKPCRMPLPSDIYHSPQGIRSLTRIQCIYVCMQQLSIFFNLLNMLFLSNLDAIAFFHCQPEKKK